MNHWIVFIVGLIATIVVWYLLIFIVGLIAAIAVWKFLSQSLSDNNTSEQDNEDNEKWENCTDENVLREAVRLAELKIEEFSNSVRIIEHKAIALITLCFAIIGYSYAIEWSGNFFELLRVVALFSLFISSLFGIIVLFLGLIGIAGMPPKASLWASKQYKLNENKKTEFSKLSLFVLQKYHESIEKTKKTKDIKTKKLKSAIKFLLIGISALSGWIVAKGLLFLM